MVFYKALQFKNEFDWILYVLDTHLESVVRSYNPL